MSPRRKGGFTAPAPRRYDGIVLQAKHAGQQHVLTVFTKQAGILRVFSRRSGRKKQGFGAFLPLSAITFEALPQGDSYTMSEYDCQSNRAMRDMTLEGYVYSQLFVEMVRTLVPSNVADAAVYTLLATYAKAVETKDIRLATIIAGWQLVALAGFVPDLASVRVFAGLRDAETAYYIADEAPEGMEEVSVTPAVKQDWTSMLRYRWDQAEIVRFRAGHVAFLERLLYSYVEQCSERPLRSLTLWRDIQS